MIRLQADPEAVASILFSLGDGFGIQVLADPAWDRRPRSTSAWLPPAACSEPLRSR